MFSAFFRKTTYNSICQYKATQLWNYRSKVLVIIPKASVSLGLHSAKSFPAENKPHTAPQCSPLHTEGTPCVKSESKCRIPQVRWRFEPPSCLYDLWICWQCFSPTFCMSDWKWELWQVEINSFLSVFLHHGVVIEYMENVTFRWGEACCNVCGEGAASVKQWRPVGVCVSAWVLLLGGCLTRVRAKEERPKAVHSFPPSCPPTPPLFCPLLSPRGKPCTHL